MTKTQVTESYEMDAFHRILLTLVMRVKSHEESIKSEHFWKYEKLMTLLEMSRDKNSKGHPRNTATSGKRQDESHVVK